jgi:hypothetical protein
MLSEVDHMIVDLEKNSTLMAHDICDRFDMSAKVLRRIMSEGEIPDILSYEWLDKCLN